jgi:hypothetical protein
MSSLPSLCHQGLLSGLICPDKLSDCSETRKTHGLVLGRFIAFFHQGLRLLCDALTSAPLNPGHAIAVD